jgi:nucleotide-binding universal stress UspA family protein
VNKSCHILVPAAFNASSDAVLDYALSLAWRVGATVDLLHVWNPHATQPQPDLHTVFFADSSDGIAMEEMLSCRHRHGVEVRGRLEFGEVGDTIARVATTDHFDLVVMGRSRSCGPSSSSIARSVARTVRCPIITVSAAMEPDHTGGQPQEWAARANASPGAFGAD